MIIVASKSQIYGPFQDANEALHWCRRHSRMISESYHPLVIQELASPEFFGEGWRVRTMAEAANGR